MILNERCRDVIQELFNIGAGRAASTLNDFVQQRVFLQVPEVFLCDDRDQAIAWVEKTLDDQKLAIVQMAFQGDMEGRTSLAFSRKSAQLLASILSGNDCNKPDAELNAVGESVLVEVGNVLMNGVMGTLGNMLNMKICYQVPQFLHHNVELMVAEENASFLMARAKMTVAELEMEGVILVLFALHSHDHFLSAVERLAASK